MLGINMITHLSIKLQTRSISNRQTGTRTNRFIINNEPNLTFYTTTNNITKTNIIENYQLEVNQYTQILIVTANDLYIYRINTK